MRGNSNLTNGLFVRKQREIPSENRGGGWTAVRNTDCARGSKLGRSFFIFLVRMSRVFSGLEKGVFASRMDIRRSKLIRWYAAREKKGTGTRVRAAVHDNIGMHASPAFFAVLASGKRRKREQSKEQKRPKLRGKNKNVHRRTKLHSGLPGRRTKRLVARRSPFAWLTTRILNLCACSSTFYSCPSAPLCFLRRPLSSSSSSIFFPLNHHFRSILRRVSPLSISVNDPVCYIVIFFEITINFATMNWLL